MIKIDKNISIDSYSKKRTTINMHPWPDMQIGDSFEIACTEEEVNSLRGSVYYSCRTYREHINSPSFTVTTRRTPKGFRVWRTE